MNEMNSNWEFSPKGKVQQEFCYKTEESLRWHEDSGEKSLTTNQLIIQENSILQFKVRLTELLIAEESFFLAFKFMHDLNTFTAILNTQHNKIFLLLRAARQKLFFRNWIPSCKVMHCFYQDMSLDSTHLTVIHVPCIHSS